MRRAAVCVEFSPGELVQRGSFFNYLAITTYWSLSVPWEGWEKDRPLARLFQTKPKT